MRERDQKRAEGDRRYASEFVATWLVGEKIGEGLRSRVYELRAMKRTDIKGDIYSFDGTSVSTPDLSESMVIKVPRRESIFSPSTTSVKLAKLKVGYDVLSDFVVSPSYILDVDNKYAILQRRLVEYEAVTPNNMGLVVDQLSEMFARHRLLAELGMSVDFLGVQGLTNCLKSLRSKNVVPSMENVVIEHTSIGPKVRVHDITVSGLPREHSRGRVLSGVMKVERRVANVLVPRLIKHHFGFDVV